MNIYIKGYKRDGHDDEPQLGMGWYMHWKGNPYKALTVYFNLIWFRLSVTVTNDWKLYEASYPPPNEIGFGLFSLFLKRRVAFRRPDWTKSDLAPFIRKAKTTPLKNKDNV